MRKNRLETRTILLSALIILVAGAVPVHSGTLVFSTPKSLAVLPWAGPSSTGVPAKGPEGMLVDPHGRIYLQQGPQLQVYSSQGQYQETWKPLGAPEDFFGFTGLEALEGKLLLLARLESPQERSNKDNFEERSKPGARLVVLDGKGKILSDKEYWDEQQPHSIYFLSHGEVYSLHDDGSFEGLGPSSSPAEIGLKDYARNTRTNAAWLEHLEKLPVFHTSDRIYHDVQGGVHKIPAATAHLLGRTFVEGLGPLALRGGRTYYRILLSKENFLPAVFVEDPRSRRYGLVELIPGDGDLPVSPAYVVFVDLSGNIYEGVAKKDGYQIYKWDLER